MADQRILVQVDGRTVELSNLDKVLYPAAGFTKSEVLDYYTRVAPVLLAHLRDRPLTRIRYPNGVDGDGFFEKNAPAGMPAWVRVERLPAPGSASGRQTLDYVVADDLATLVWLANLAALELHVPQWRIGSGWPPRPDLLVIDLDPGPGTGLDQCATVALWLRDRLATDGLTAYPKTSGRKGMQLSCRLAATQDAEEVSGYARRIAEQAERELPRLVTARMAKNLRAGKVFIDWSQNNAAKTTIAPYSLRAGAHPTASAPLTWDEVRAGGLVPLQSHQVLDRIHRYGELFVPAEPAGRAVPAAPLGGQGGALGCREREA